MTENDKIISIYINHLANESFPCIGARLSVRNHRARYMVAEHLACPKDDTGILNFLYDFVDEYRNKPDNYCSASVIFKQPETITEEEFDTFLWRRLQALADMDSVYYDHDSRVSADPGSPEFCFSLKEEAFFIIGMHASSSRLSRQYPNPVLVFNPHAQFENLRENGKYKKMQSIIRKRDMDYSGSVNPMLTDFSEGPEVFQYSGRKYDDTWQCPLKINDAKIKHNTSP